VQTAGQAAVRESEEAPALLEAHKHAALAGVVAVQQAVEATRGLHQHQTRVVTGRLL
jgi:hypothetical protein